MSMKNLIYKNCLLWLQEDTVIVLSMDGICCWMSIFTWTVKHFPWTVNQDDNRESPIKTDLSAWLNGKCMYFYTDSEIKKHMSKILSCNMSVLQEGVLAEVAQKYFIMKLLLIIM